MYRFEGPLFGRELGRFDFGVLAKHCDNFPTTFSIIGLYSGVVLIVWRQIRIVVMGHVNNIIYREMPVVDQLFQLCMDLYLV